MNRKTISKIVTSALPAICLSVYNVSDCHAGELLREIQAEQRKLPNVTYSQIMQNVFKNYNNLSSEVKDTLTTIWNNDAGNLLLRRLHNIIKDDTQRITIFWNACDKDGESNLFYHDMTIYLDTRKFGQCIGYRNGELCALPETLDAVLFHEMTHGLHKLIGLKNTGKQNSIHHLHAIPNYGEIYNKYRKAWTDDEEIHTTTGLYLGADGKLHFDCLNTNSYMVLKALKNGIPMNRITQRVFHCDYNSLSHIFPAYYINIENIVIRAEKYLDMKLQEM